MVVAGIIAVKQRGQRLDLDFMNIEHSKDKQKIFFLVRAYNDLDCRIPLILNFASDKFYNVRIVGIPTNNGYNHPEKHELYETIKQKGVKFQSIFLSKNIPIYIRYIYYVHKWARYNLKNIERKSKSQMLNFLLSRIINFPLIFFVRHNKKWIAKAVNEMKNSIIIIDEIAFQKNRSNVVKEIVDNKDKNNFSMYVLQTGQNTFTNLWFDKEKVIFKTHKIPIAKKYIVPSENDKNILKEEWPNENIIVAGNTRFDSSWINTLAEIASKNIEKDHLLKKNSNKKIVFMLSKIEYGVDLQNLVETINICATIENSCVIIKPHTRGMTLDATKNQLNNNVYNGTKYSSNELTVWADTVLFTGSSIIFQAILLKKKVIYLKHCHKYNTIFDDSDAVLIANSANDVKKFVIEVGIDKTIQEKVDNFLKVNIHNGINSGLVCKNIKNQIEQWESSNLKGSET